MIDQLFIGLFGLTAIALANCKSEKLRRFACLFGIAAQPFWFYTTWTHGQYGIFAMSFIYASLWLMGVWHNWVAPWAKERWRIRFCATYDALGFLGWMPWCRTIRHTAIWRNVESTYTRDRELYVIGFNWQLHWTWRVKL